jgi:hypothetical protein
MKRGLANCVLIVVSVIGSGDPGKHVALDCPLAHVELASTIQGAFRGKGVDFRLAALLDIVFRQACVKRAIGGRIFALGSEEAGMAVCLHGVGDAGRYDAAQHGWRQFEAS